MTCQKQDDYECALDALRIARQKGPTGNRAGKVLEYLAKWSHHWALPPANGSKRDKLILQAAGLVVTIWSQMPL